MQELLELALDDPAAALEQARSIAGDTVDSLTLSYALQASGIAAREQHDLELALTSFRKALRAATASGDPDRVADVRASYGGTLVFAGRTRVGLRHLETARREAGGTIGARVAMRHAYTLAVLGLHDQALVAMCDALAGARATGDRLWEARALNNLAHIHLRLGSVSEARECLVEAERTLASEELPFEVLDVLGNRGEVAVMQGDLAAGLRLYAQAVDAWAATGQPVPTGLLAAQADAFLTAGLAAEAVRVLGEAAAAEGLLPTREAELMLSRARALQVDRQHAAARSVAEGAAQLFRSQGRTWWESQAELVVLAAAVALDVRQALEPMAERVASALDEVHADEAPVALTLLGRLAGGPARLAAWQRAASYRHHPNALVRAGAWHAQALARDETRDRGGVLRAAAAGLDAIDEHRRLLGSTELRALATTHGRDLTTIALRHAATDPRTLLRWSERTRATALAQPPATSDAATIPASLAALRDNGRQLAEARQEGAATEELERERRRLERAVRAESHTLSATTAAQQRPASVEDILAATDDTCLVELVEVDGKLHVVVAHAGKVRRRVAGDTSEIASLLGPAGMLLRRAARGRPADTAPVGRALQEAILGDAVRVLPDTPVVLAPTARLHGLAWSLLPTLRDRPFAVVPSAGQWLRARATTPPDDASTLLVAGPSLDSGGAEVPVLAERHPDATLLDGPRATLDAVLAHLDGAGLVHLAAHGRFRADSPLFSALDLADGPLTVHDLERVPRAPYRVVLSACESGVLAPVGAEELLGLAAALFSLGTAGLVCSVAEVNDAATADLMVDLHAALARGSDPATALCEVRRQVAGDPVAAGTAAAFLALGV